MSSAAAAAASTTTGTYADAQGVQSVSQRPLRLRDGAGRFTRDPYRATPDDERRREVMRVAFNAYEGVFHAGDEQWPLKWKRNKEPNPNVPVNRCGPAVNIDVSWLMGEQVGITLVKATKEAQAYADTVWGVSSEDSSDDDKMLLLQKLAKNGAKAGHTFLKIACDVDPDTGQLSDPANAIPQLVVLDPRTVRVHTDPHNVDIPICYIIEYPLPDPDDPNGAPGMYRQVIERVDPDNKASASGLPDDDTTWTIQDYWKPAKASQFTPQGKLIPWPYAWAPIDGCPHIAEPNVYYGNPRLTSDAIRLNEAIITNKSNINKIGVRHGAPVLYTIKQGATQGRIEYEPGTILPVSSDIKAVEAPGDIPGLRAFGSDLDTAFEEATHIPALAFGRTEAGKRSGPVSGESIKMDFQALLADVGTERRSYGSLIRRVTQHLLELRDPTWAALGVTLTWPDPIPTNLQQAAQVIQIALQEGVMSKKTAAEKLLKLDWQTEQDNMQQEAQDEQDAIAKGLKASPPPPPMQPGQEQPPNVDITAAQQQQQPPSAQQGQQQSAAAPAKPAA